MFLNYFLLKMTIVSILATNGCSNGSKKCNIGNLLESV